MRHDGGRRVLGVSCRCAGRSCSWVFSACPQSLGAGWGDSVVVRGARIPSLSSDEPGTPAEGDVHVGDKIEGDKVEGDKIEISNSKNVNTGNVDTQGGDVHIGDVNENTININFFGSPQSIQTLGR